MPNFDETGYCEHFTDAKVFLDNLNPNHERWTYQDDWKNSWIYRGQSNANWKLLPSALRETEESIDSINRLSDTTFYDIKNSVDKYGKNCLGYLGFTDISDELIERLSFLLLKITIEQENLSEFVKLANDVGHPVFGIHSIPNGSDISYMIMEHKTFSNIEISRSLVDFANFRIYDKQSKISALAQHHGISTRLLDFTHSPRIAVFFALSSIDPIQTESIDKFAVIAINDGFKQYINSINPPQSIKTLHIPRSEITYLHAQEGIFLYDSEFYIQYLKTGLWLDFERSLQNHYGDEVPPHLYIQKLTLPYSEAYNLFKLLWRERISPAHLMPTYDNVTQALKLKWSWQKNEFTNNPLDEEN